jgi:hypothetical protein
MLNEVLLANFEARRHARRIQIRNTSVNSSKGGWQKVEMVQGKVYLKRSDFGLSHKCVVCAKCCAMLFLNRARTPTMQQHEVDDADTHFRLDNDHLDVGTLQRTFRRKKEVLNMRRAEKHKVSSIKSGSDCLKQKARAGILGGLPLAYFLNALLFSTGQLRHSRLKNAHYPRGPPRICQ